MPGYPPLHGPARPEWTCVVCREPWPCLIRRDQLRELCQGDAGMLVGYLGPYLKQARRDLDGVSDGELTERFLGWCGG